MILSLKIAIGIFSVLQKLTLISNVVKEKEEEEEEEEEEEKEKEEEKGKKKISLSQIRSTIFFALSCC